MKARVGVFHCRRRQLVAPLSLFLRQSRVFVVTLFCTLAISFGRSLLPKQTTAVVNIDAEPTITQYQSCTIPARSYPVFGYEIGDDEHGRLVVPTEMYERPLNEVVPIATPTCPDIGIFFFLFFFLIQAVFPKFILGFRENACGASDLKRRVSFNTWSCSLPGYSPRSYMCSRCQADQNYIKIGVHCVHCADVSKFAAPIAWLALLFLFVFYVIRIASYKSYVLSTVVFHLQMIVSL